ncbi:MAG: putative N-acyltransferase [Gammaproteobacteria bacterium]
MAAAKVTALQSNRLESCNQQVSIYRITLNATQTVAHTLMEKITIHCHDSISTIEKDAWENLAHRSKFTSYAWLQATSDYCGDPSQLQLLLAYVGDDLQGAMILETVGDAGKQNSVARAVLGGNKIVRGAIGRYFVPNLAVGTPHGYGGHLLLASHSGDELRAKISKKLISAAETLSESLRTPLWFMGVLEADDQLLKALQQNGYLSARYLPLAEMAIEWNTFEEYLSWQKRRSRSVSKDIRRERNRCRAAGLIFEEPSDVSKLDNVLIELANQPYQKHGEHKFPFERGFFTSLQEQLGSSFMLCTARKGDNVIGFVTMLSDGESAWADSYGLDYGQAESAFVYFNLVYHWPVQKAIELGLKRIVFGRGQYELKLRRGCVLTDTYLLYKPSKWIARKIYSHLFRVVDDHYAMNTTRVSND